MPRSVNQILGLLGTKDPHAVSVYPLDPYDPVEAPPPANDVWAADFGRFTASVTADEKNALVAAGAHESPHR